MYPQTLQRLQQNLNILCEREAKCGGNAPPELLNQIDDHEQAIELTGQASAGELSEAAWREALRPLLVDIRDRSEANPEWGVTVGDVEGGIIGAIIAGRDIVAEGDIVTGVKGQQSAQGEGIAQVIGNGAATVNVEHHYSYHYYQNHPVDPALNPEADLEPLPDLFPPARHLIGRQNELVQLRAAFEQVVIEQTGQIVFITGNRGYGRLALARALAEQVQQQGQPVIIGRFKPQGRLPVNLQPDSLWRDDPFIGPALAVYESQLKQYWPNAVKIGGISWLALAAQIAQVLGYAPAPTTYRGVSDTPEAIKRMLRVASRRRPGLLLLLENLDEAPPTWITLLKYLAAEIYQPRTLPLLVVATAHAAQPIPSLDRQKFSDTLHLAHTLQKNNKGQTLWLGSLLPGEVAVYLDPARPAVSERLHFLADGIPTLVEGLWQEWQVTDTVTQDEAGYWHFAADNPWLISGDMRDQAHDLLDACLDMDDPLPYSRWQIEEMLSTAALEGYMPHATTCDTCKVKGQLVQRHAIHFVPLTT